MLRSAPLGIAAAVIAIACCAGLPLVAGALGGLALIPVLGISGAVLAVVCAAAAVLRLRRKGFVR